MMAAVANGQPHEEDINEYSSTFDAVPYPNTDGYGLKGQYTLW